MPNVKLGQPFRKKDFSVLLHFFLKFIYSEKATKFCETFLLSYVVPVKSKVTISQNFVASSEYMNFTKPKSHLTAILTMVYYEKLEIQNSFM